MRTVKMSEAIGESGGAVIKIKGMTCPACEMKIQKKLEGADGILSARVSYTAGTAILTYRADTISIEAVKTLITDLGYETESGGDGKSANGGVTKLMKTVGMLAGLLIIFAALNVSGVFEFANVFPRAEADTGLWMLFVIGLLTSVHCAAMCGGINISQNVNADADGTADSENPPDAKNRATAAEKNRATAAEKNRATACPADAKIRATACPAAEKNRTATACPTDCPAAVCKKPGIKTFRSSLLYNSGRIISYTAIGAIAGALGTALTFSDAARGAVTIFAAAFMIIAGLNMLGAFPFLKKLTPRLPKFLRGFIDAKRDGSRSPLAVGLLNGFMPCGPLQAMQIYALSTGSWYAGAAAMLLFGLGTVPLMFGIGALSALLTKQFAKKLTAASAALVIIFGMFMFTNGAALSGVALPALLGGTGPAVESVIDAPNNIQVVSFDLKPNAYAAIKVKKGVPVRWIIRAAADDLNSCNGELKIQRLGITKTLTEGENIIEFTPQSAGNIAYSCWMGMIKSKIIVTN
ncbi:MAG: sulfite exporter TauE/SafE family protein [Clostridiales bacterium]|jgi:sulfite exporter TauE/SafE/copper chaperone CopZ|nr:sulfite exporter TauE/SafE family protein [Clostridiales bacterium]